MTFLLDLFMLIAVGIFIAIICKTFYKEDSFLPYTLCILTLLVFYAVSLSLFCELNGREHGLLGTLNDIFWGIMRDRIFVDYYNDHPNATSTEFMYTTGLECLKPYVPFNNLAGLVRHPLYLLFGMVMFVLYPGWLYLGVQLGWLMFGRKKGDKGALGFL